MATSVGELFVSLGVKGSDKTLNAIVSVKDGIGGIASTSLEAKAAIAGIFYGIEQLVASSAKLGTTLLNFSALTGQASKSAEQWGNAARVAGGSFDEVLQTFTKVQAIMTQIQTLQSNPRALAYLQKFTGFDRRQAGDMTYVMEHLRDFSKLTPQSGLSAGLRDQLLSELGYGPGMIALSNRHIFDPNNIAGQPSTSVGGQKALASVQAGFERIGLQWETEFKNLTIKHSGGIQGIAALSKALIGLITAADKLGTSSGLFTLIDMLTRILGVSAQSASDLANLKGPKDVPKNSPLNTINAIDQFIGLNTTYDYLKNSLPTIMDHLGALTVINNINVSGAIPHPEKFGKSIGNGTSEQIKKYTDKNSARKQ